jgi:Skp family chaperone for outer membrane proteins
MQKKRFPTLLTSLILFLLLSAARAFAIEVSLEENKFEKGSIGYVDMHVLFKLFPETQKAKLSFEDAMHQTEEQVNLRRAELIGLRAELARLEAEKSFAQKASSAPLVDISSPEIKGRPNLITPPNIPGAGTEFAAIAGSSSTPNIPLSVASSTAAAVDPMTAKIQQLDRSIADKSKILETKEADFKTFEDQAEKSLLDLESRKTEILLGRIYGTIQDVAKSEGVSVVVDKSQILFGHQAVDLTDKVLKKLKTQ